MVRVAFPVEVKKLPVTIDQYVCGKEKVAEDLVVNAQRGVRNAVVWLKNPPPVATGDAVAPRPDKVEMDQKGCVFVPRVVLVPAGGTVEFLNSDRLLHNLHSTSQDNPTFNRTQPRGRVIPIAFARPEIIRVNCDLHSWMRGWVVVADHPFYAMSDDNGEFALSGVPPGKYTLQIWQESLGISSQDVTVTGDEARVTVDLKASR
ncbi:MAG TPA: carboxypeptidase regulatory-like domain-containing protein [Methylomirabilota bacterium]|nr:carboxypeptidase regulatory-like domain-containing protein [Methylomirabilota bacterium]